MECIPDESKISSYATNAYFSDCFTSVTRYENQSALDIFLSIARKSPNWINFLMSLRNNIVSKFGLKNLGSLSDIEQYKSAIDYKVGDRVGIFTLHFNSHNEVILEDRDKHLNVKVSFYIEPNGNTARIYASTVVHVKNTLGKIYMLFVTPMHKLIVPSTLKALPKA
ncbi:DUF2867 domain-containing protein [Alteromonas confluentis]|uniref:DUF2867 domain-containing protein n=1 Tax=Alteromonas confluentis TaxID=1656094 RepID=A0A1E7Z7U0_9ALTE|nr:DUF2867 domain-containing protein [Alteromonas confluentis]OFC69598.1 hypothetical protein BFC18_17210 [Alteromonas confluentis]